MVTDSDAQSVHGFACAAGSACCIACNSFKTPRSFVDSSALALLVKGMKHCRQGGGDLALCSLQQPVKVIFELTRLDKAFGIYSTQDEAIQALHDKSA